MGDPRRIVVRGSGTHVTIGGTPHRVQLGRETVALIEQQRPDAIVQPSDISVRVPQPCSTVRAGGGMGVQGPPGPPGTGGEQVVRRKKAAQILGGHRIVRSVDAERVAYADASDIEGVGEVLGLTLTAALSGADVDVMVDGDVEEPGWHWIAGESIYLGSDGQLVQIDPADAGAAVALEAGYATSPTSMRVRIGIPVEL